MKKKLGWILVVISVIVAFATFGLVSIIVATTTGLKALLYCYAALTGGAISFLFGLNLISTSYERN